MNKKALEAYNNGVCEVCHRDIIYPSGSPKAPVLMFGAYPRHEEIRKGKPWVGNVGKALRGEMSRAGLSEQRVRLTNVWLHKEKEEECKISWHMDILLFEMKRQKPEAVMVMGSLPARLFFEEKVSDITGLEVTSPYFPPSVKVSMAMVDPMTAHHGGIGEVRLAIQRFAKLVDELRMSNDIN